MSLWVKKGVNREISKHSMQLKVPVSRNEVIDVKDIEGQDCIFIFHKR
jgi:hypothetical protein